MARTMAEKYYKWSEWGMWRKTWLATTKAVQVEWEKVCKDGTDSTYAVASAIYRIINQQAGYSERVITGDLTKPIVNFYFIEWRLIGGKLIWPFGTLYMPVAVSVQAVSGNMISNMDYKNGIFPVELLGEKWQE